MNSALQRSGNCGEKWLTSGTPRAWHAITILSNAVARTDVSRDVPAARGSSANAAGIGFPRASA